MRTKLIKIHSRRYMEYELLDNKNNKIYSIMLPKRSLKKIFDKDEPLTVSKGDEVVYSFKFNITNRREGSWGCEIFDKHGEKVGITYRRNKRVGLTSYSYFDFEFKNRHFECIMAGIDGTKLLIFETSTGQQVGLSETPSVVRNNLNDWTLYAKNEEEDLITLFATLQADYLRFDFRARQKFIVKKYFFATPKELNVRYQSSFKDEI